MPTLWAEKPKPRLRIHEQGSSSVHFCACTEQKRSSIYLSCSCFPLAARRQPQPSRKVSCFLNSRTGSGRGRCHVNSYSLAQPSIHPRRLPVCPSPLLETLAWMRPAVRVKGKREQLRQHKHTFCSDYSVYLHGRGVCTFSTHNTPKVDRGAEVGLSGPQCRLRCYFHWK